MMAGQDNVQWVNVSAQETLHKVIAGQETTLADFGAMNVNLRWSLGSMNQPLGDWGGRYSPLGLRFLDFSWLWEARTVYLIVGGLYS